MRHVRADLFTRLVWWGAAWVSFSLLWGVLQGSFDDVITQSRSVADTSAASNGTDYVVAAWDWAPVWIGFLLMLGLLVAALFENRRMD